MLLANYFFKELLGVAPKIPQLWGTLTFRYPQNWGLGGLWGNFSKRILQIVDFANSISGA